MSEEYPSEHDYKNWIELNAFMEHMRAAHWSFQMSEELDRLDEIDMMVDCMDEFPEVEQLLKRIIK
jgi:hypothetical protein